MSASRCGWGSWLRFLKGWGQSKDACPHSGLCCPLCTLSLWGRWGQTPRFIFPWHCVPWTGFAGSKWPGITVADPSLGARWAHKSPLSGPSPCHTAGSSLVLTRPQRGCTSPNPPQSEQDSRMRGNSHKARVVTPQQETGLVLYAVTSQCVQVPVASAGSVTPLGLVSPS